MISEYKVIITPAGSGSTHIIRQLESHARPDLVFDPFSNLTIGGFDNTGIKITDKPREDHQPHFINRTRGEFKLDLNITIEQNIVNYINFMNNQKFRRGNLCGTISAFNRQFFSRNKLPGLLAVIRHPLHAMISFLFHKHPNHGKDLGGINSESCVKFYANRWNKLTSDLLAAKIKIIRYEYAVNDSKDINDPQLISTFKTLTSSRRNFNVLQPRWEEMLRNLTERNYSKIYEKWEI